MRKVRSIIVLFVVLAAAMNPPTAAASCPGILCGFECNLGHFDFCIYNGQDTKGCKQIRGGCMSMTSLICCPRDPIF